ncbi:MAG: M23 family metallopeptidase [Pseudomonadota bacterium]
MNYQPYFKYKTRFSSFFRYRKILVISDKEIKTIPLAPKLQLLAVIVIMISLIWISYSSGKYFAYQNLIILKDQQIINTNLTNENLQHQVTDLHNNFVQLDEYFMEIQNIKERANKRIVLSSDSKDFYSATTESPLDINLSMANDELNNEEALIQTKIIENKAKSLLLSLFNQVNQQIRNFESVVSSTKLDINSIAQNNKRLREYKAKSNVKDINLEEFNDVSHNIIQNQGGPYLPADSEGDVVNDAMPYLFHDNLSNNINYLIELERLIQYLPVGRPIGKAVVTSNFGYRIDPFKKKRAKHNGIDFVGKYKAEIYSSAPGYVLRAKRNGAYGLFVEIQHDNNMKTRYGHLSKILVKKGDFVKRGSVVGLQGNTGRSTGPHLHYETLYKNKPLNPFNFIQAGKNVL